MDFKPVNVDDPRVVIKRIGGRDYKFWMCRRGMRIAKHVHGHDVEGQEGEVESAQDAVDSVLRMLWVAHLPFEPDLSFDDFEVRFLPQDYVVLFEAVQEITDRQVGEVKEAPKGKKRTPGR